MSNLSQHIREEHNSGGSECPDCGKLFVSHYLNKHIKAVHQKVKNTCDICYKKVSVSNISFHKKKHHGVVFGKDATMSPVKIEKTEANPDGPIFRPRLDKAMKKERKRLAQKKYYEKNKERIIRNVVKHREQARDTKRNKRKYVRKRTEKKLPVYEDPDDPVVGEDFVMKTEELVNVQIEADPWMEDIQNKIIMVGNKCLQVKLL